MSDPRRGPALGLLELSSLARGAVVADAAVKRAPVAVLRCDPVSPGKLLLLMRGGEAEIAEALLAAQDAAKGVLIDHVYLPHLANAVWAALAETPERTPQGEAVGLVELATCAAAIRGADAALKAADVRLQDFRLGRGIGGKGIFTITGPLSDVQAALDAARDAALPEHVQGLEIVAHPHEDLAGRLFW